MYEEGSPEWHRVMAPYLDTIVQLNANTERRTAELDAELQEYQRVLDEREADSKQELQRIEQERADAVAAEEAAKNPWGTHRSSGGEHMSFGPADDEFANAPPPERPTPPPTIPAPPAPKPKRRPSRARDDFDDEDFTNTSWMR
jgi:hypothetical protein